MTVPNARIGPDDCRQTTARSVMRAGQRQILLRQVSWLIGLMALLAAWWIGPGASSDTAPDSTAEPTLFWAAPSSWVLLAITVVAAGLTVIRGLGLLALSAASATDPQPAQPIPKAGGTVICCSGGGIKSASFVLGALQQLCRSGVYATANAIVGVSGGGYTAGAFAALGARAAGPTPPFAPGSPELAALRRRTDYLASSRRVRYDLVMSIMFGIAVNAMILAAAAVIVAVAVSEHAARMGLIAGRGIADAVWTFNPAGLDGLELLWPAIGLIGLSWCWFLAVRLRGQAHHLSPEDDPDRERWSGRELHGWVANVPNALLRCGVLYAVLYPAVVLLACAWHNWTLGTSWSGAWQGAAAALTAFVAFTAAVRSVWKGVAEPGSGKLVDQMRGFVRLRLAPWLGVGIAVVGGYALLVMLTANLLERPAAPSAWLLLIAGGVLLGLRLLPGANVSSLFPFYRDRLAWAFLQHGPQADRQPAGRPTERSARERRAKPVALHELSTGPTLVLCATASVTESDVVPAGRNGTPFVLSAAGLGLTDKTLPNEGCLVPPVHIRPNRRSGPVPFPLRLQDAVAISGAAIAPLSGREDKRIGPYRLLLALGNVRLGAWVRNPYWLIAPRPSAGWAAAVRTVNDLLDRASWLRVVDEAIRSASVNSPYLYVHDGGHYDNLGLVEALRRKPDEIILLDGTGDPEDQFSAMGDAIATARMDLGVEVSFDPRPLIRGEGSHPARGWVTAHARYPDGSSTCSILYIKGVLPEGLSWDLESYRLRNEGFPNGSNKYEMYDEFDFEAYRHLGECLVEGAMRDRTRPGQDKEAARPVDDPPVPDRQPAQHRNGAAKLLRDGRIR